ncbi:MAG: VOC family protein [Anaerolineales bacterium]|nr:VOC family protein [Anaerolineales bacterium]
MQLGAFSVSLSVKDIKVSKSFYQKLGFAVFGGDETQNWLIMKNGDHVIGLFQGMFEQNILTFNPGWDQNAQPVDSFTDVRDLQKALKAQGIKFASEADERSTGPASFIVMDPDGNPILVDQHV